MHFITQDKYRMKIIEHVLNQETNKSISKSEHNHVEDKFCQEEKTKVIQPFCKEAKKQKPLIKDQQQIQIDKSENILNSPNLDFKRTKGKNRSQTKKLLNECFPQLKRHQNNTDYHFHQKPCIMSLSQNDEEKVVKTCKSLLLKQNGKQNAYDSFNKKIPKEQKPKQKNYRFIVTHQQNQLIPQHNQLIQQQNQHRQFSKEVQTQKHSYENQCKQNCDDALQKSGSKQFIWKEQKERSKGSKEMIHFLESARQKLFKNSLQFEESNNLDPQKIIQGKVNVQNIEVNVQNAQVSVQRIQAREQDFQIQIQIQVKPGQKCIIKVHNNSNIQELAEQFLTEKYKDFDNRLSECRQIKYLLVEQINNKINQHRQLIKKYPKKQFSQSQNFSINRPKYNHFTHVQLEQSACETNRTYQNDSSHQQEQKLDSQNLQQMKNIQCLNVQMQKLISFSYQDKSSQNINQPKFMNSPQQIVKTSRFIQQEAPQSPHQLLTYRNATPQSNNQTVHRQKQPLEHIPLSQFTVRANQKESEPNQLNRQIKTTSIELGAEKILSKSRNKGKRLSTVTNRVNIENKKVFVDEKNGPNTAEMNKKIENKLSNERSVSNQISQEIVKRLGKQNILLNLKNKQRVKKQKLVKELLSKKEAEMKQCSFHPQINNLSKSIEQNKKKLRISRFIELGHNQKCLDHNFNQTQRAKLFSEQKSNNSKQTSSKQQSEAKLIRTPNPNLPKRSQELYQLHRSIESKKQKMRKNSFEAIPFKPEINKISRKIVESKKNSLNNSLVFQNKSFAQSRNVSMQSSKCKYSQNNTHSKCMRDQYNFNRYQHKRNSLNCSRNLEGLPIGDYLHKQAMRMKKKKTQSLEKYTVTNFKPTKKSQQILQDLKIKRFSQYFDWLAWKQTKNISQKFIDSESINLESWEFKQIPFKLLVPLLEELKQLDVKLGKQQFIASCYKLYDYLCQNEKNILLHYENEKSHSGQVVKNSNKFINKISNKILEKNQYAQKNIYERSLVFKNNLQQKIAKQIQRKNVSQLQGCTFQPKSYLFYKTLH